MKRPKLPMICMSVCLCSGVYSLLSVPQPSECVMVLLIVASAANAGGLFFWAIYRRRPLE